MFIAYLHICLLLTFTTYSHGKKELPTAVPFFVFKLSTFPVFYFA